jgi:hypothetical protein
MAKWRRHGARRKWRKKQWRQWHGSINGVSAGNSEKASASRRQAWRKINGVENGEAAKAIEKSASMVKEKAASAAKRSERRNGINNNGKMKSEMAINIESENRNGNQRMKAAAAAASKVGISENGEMAWRKK